MEEKKTKTPVKEKPKKEERTFYQDYANLMQEVARLSKNEANPFFNSAYTPLKDILAEAKRVCLSNNFIFYQLPETNYEIVTLRTVLRHESEEKIESVLPLVRKDNTDPQKLGASLTYMRRYELTSMLGIEEDDDDGNKASTPMPKPQSKEEAEFIQ